jgi:hypothetical protein
MGKEEIYTAFLLENLMGETVGMTEVEKWVLWGWTALNINSVEFSGRVFLYSLWRNFRLLYLPFGDTRWRSLLRHCATSQKVAGSIPDGVIGIFHWLNPSNCTIALGLTQPRTEMSTRDFSVGDKGGRCIGLTILPSSCANCLEILGASTSWSPKDLSRPVME